MFASFKSKIVGSDWVRLFILDTAHHFIIKAPSKLNSFWSSLLDFDYKE